MNPYHLVKRNLLRGLLALIISSAALVVLPMILRPNIQALAGRPLPDSASTALPQSSYLFRFDPNRQAFYTYVLPFGSVPYGLAVTGTNPTHIWVAEYARNRIGHLVYTSTKDVRWTEYPITTVSDSGPFRITLAGAYVWFTERGANRVGRLNATTGQIDEFYNNGLPPNAGLADIKVAPNGWIWVTGELSNQLIRLVVTSTYAFSGYTNTLLVDPFGLAIESSNSIWFTLPAAHRIGRFTPSNGLYLWPFSFPANSRPYEIVVTPGFAWFSDWQLNSIGQVEIGTLTNLNLYGLIDRSAGLASGSPNTFWTTQQDEQGAIARLVYTSPASTHIDSYPIPTSGLYPTGIAVASDQSVWLGAFMPIRMFLPTVLRN